MAMIQIRESAWRMETIRNVNTESWQGDSPQQKNLIFFLTFARNQESPNGPLPQDLSR